MSDTLDRVTAIGAYYSGIPAAKLTVASAVDQDLKITGDDVSELAEALSKEFGPQVLQWPWHRFAELSEPSGFLLFIAVWRLMTWPIRGRLSDPSPFERLELGHVAAVIDRGEWFEP